MPEDDKKIENVKDVRLEGLRAIFSAAVQRLLVVGDTVFPGTRRVPLQN